MRFFIFAKPNTRLLGLSGIEYQKKRGNATLWKRPNPVQGQKDLRKISDTTPFENDFSVACHVKQMISLKPSKTSNYNKIQWMVTSTIFFSRRKQLSEEEQKPLSGIVRKSLFTEIQVCGRLCSAPSCTLAVRFFLGPTSQITVATGKQKKQQNFHDEKLRCCLSNQRNLVLVKNQ